MKSVSAAILVLAGSIMFSVGALAPDSPGHILPQPIGALVGLLGLAGWMKELWSAGQNTSN
jgi:protein-S-isoprenylcysteine O-methyltransferase Ste14